MVYCGVLSKGCERCRRRKTKCDQQKPGCSQCARMRTTCPGYRDLADIMFRDDTAAVIRRVEAEHAEKMGSRENNWSAIRASLRSTPDFDVPNYVSFVPPPSSPNILSSSRKDQAASFFFASYVISDPPFSETYLKWLSRLYSQESSDQILHAVIESVGMAGMSNVFHDPDMMIEAKRRYGRALAITNNALRDSVEMKKDSTIVAILSLGLFETITFENWQQYRPWKSHIEGAAALLQFRGEEQFERDLGNFLFVQLRVQVVNGCFQTDTPLPSTITKWLKRPPATNINDELRYQQDSLTMISARIAILRSAVKRNELSDLTTIVSTALDIDADLEAWIPTLSSHNAYDTVLTTAQPSDECLESFYHIYKYLWTAQVWNSYRLLRLILHDTVLGQVDAASSGTPTHEQKAAAVTTQFDRSRTLVRRLCSDICASVPFLLDAYPDRPRASPKPTQRAMGGLMLLYPLFGGVCQSSHINDRMRVWAIGRLQYINSEMGIRQAGLMAATMTRM